MAWEHQIDIRHVAPWPLSADEVEADVLDLLATPSSRIPIPAQWVSVGEEQEDDADCWGDESDRRYVRVVTIGIDQRAGDPKGLLLMADELAKQGEQLGFEAIGKEHPTQVPVRHPHHEKPEGGLDDRALYWAGSLAHAMDDRFERRLRWDRGEA